MATRKELRAMVEAQDYKCNGTGVPLEPWMASLDHKQPRSLGGSNELDNLHVVHFKVNKAKGEMGWDEFVSMCHAVAAMHEDTGAAWWEGEAAAAGS